ncbi:MAG: GGDEF domain-containing protein, partial [Lachnospiraceae bacterium]|nr:GGDEF domain-containing protein [Lachnospiraceae bacterium]
LCSLIIVSSLLILSYFIKRSDIIVTVFAVEVLVLFILACDDLGWVLSGYGFIAIVIMMIWYDSAKTIKYKLSVSGLVTLTVCVFLLRFSAQRDITIDQTTYNFLLVISTVILAICVCLASFLLSRENVDSERKLIQYNEKLKTMAGIDALTGLMNRRSINETFEALLHENTQCITVAMGDIDFFKKVNDTRGHDCGDYVLKTLGGMFLDFMKDKGYASRWGGEEFVLIFVNINGDDAYFMMDQFRKKIENTEFEFFSHKFNITMTFGVEEYSPRFGAEEAIKKADEKLYLGKEAGRNRVIY